MRRASTAVAIPDMPNSSLARHGHRLEICLASGRRWYLVGSTPYEYGDKKGLGWEWRYNYASTPDEIVNVVLTHLGPHEMNIATMNGSQFGEWSSELVDV